VDLMQAGLGAHKHQAQRALKYQKSKGILFTARANRPQQYFPTCIKSRVLENQLQKNVHMNPTGVHSLHHHLSYAPAKNSNHPLSQIIETLTYQTLENYILPLLPKAGLAINNLHMKCKIIRDCYHELKLKPILQNNGKQYFEIIGASRVNYTFYPSGTVNVEIECSDHPLKLENELDRTRIFDFLGQVRDRLIGLLMDKHERIVPDILEWYITECDLNRDVRVSDALHVTRLNFQIRHLDHLFRIYIKAMGEDTVCRVEENKRFKNKPAIDVINDIFNPYEKIKKSLDRIENILDDKKVNN